MPNVTVADLAALAEALTKAAAENTKTAKALATLIAAEGKRIGDAHGSTYARAAKDQVEEVEKAAAIEIQRRDDVIDELRKQLEIQVRHVRRGYALEKRIRELAAKAKERREGVPAGILLIAIADAQDVGGAADTEEA